MTTEQETPLQADPRDGLADRLTSDPQLWERLGFTGQDLIDVRRWAETVLADDTAAGLAARQRVAAHAAALADRVGDFGSAPSPFGSKEEDGYPIDGAGHGYGTLAILALGASVDAIRRFHAERGVSDETSWETLADLGQQVRVHRLTYGEFGLHTHSWMRLAWSGILYGQGRLQFNLSWYVPAEGAAGGPQERWVLSTHIPAIGPLTPQACDESFARARTFFAEHFPDYPTTEFWCTSWLLDPRLAGLDPASNTARFQARWAIEGEGSPDSAGVVFFVWHRRDEIDPATLPTDSSLRRLVAGELVAGRPWRLTTGLIPQSEAVLGS